MKETRLFYTPVWQSSLSDGCAEWPVARQAMLERIHALKAEGAGTLKSNFGGWQSEDDIYRYPEFGWLIGRVMEQANRIADAFSATRRFDDGIMWANVNGRGHFNSIHTHPDSVLSGVTYLAFTREEQGIIQFLDAREGSPTTHWRCYMNLNESTPLIDEAYSVVPREGEILLFPGWLKHWVTPNLTDEERISVSFNVRMG